MFCVSQDKYTLLEEDDIDFVRRFTLEAKLEVDRVRIVCSFSAPQSQRLTVPSTHTLLVQDGRGAKVFAVAQTEDSETGGPSKMPLVVVVLGGDVQSNTTAT